MTGLKVVKTAYLSTNEYFFKLVSDITFVLILFVCVLVALWLWPLKMFGPEHLITKMFSVYVYLSLCVVILFMIGFYLFNRTHPPERALKFWTFTKEISWPWAWEGLKASGIILLGICVFLVPGIIKSVHYTFFSFIVFFDQDYKAGKVSCLKRSKELSKGIGWWIFGLGIVLPFLIQSAQDVFLTSFLKINSLWILYPVLVLYVYVISLCFTYLCSMLYFMYITQHKVLYEKS